MELKEIRDHIDALDRELVATFEKRLAYILEVAKYKEAHNMSIFDAEREEEVLARNLAGMENEETRPYVKAFLETMMDISKQFQKDHINQPIFLIGMPGAGKTTVGKALANRLDMEFFDVDALIQEKTGKSIQNIIIYDGEPAFREYEYEVIHDIVTHHKASVIATGGGTVMSDKTVALMRETGFVVYIRRGVTQILDDLDLEIRPLLKESIEYIFRLYEERCPRYEEVGHVMIENASNISDCVDEIIAKLPNVEA